MIIICEECQTRYLLPSHSLAPDGRRVRCTVCSHEWYQEYEDESFSDESGDDDGEIDVEPIPDAVKPIPEGSSVPSLEVSEQGKVIPWGSIAAASGAFVLVFLLLIVLRTPVTNMWPQSGVFYALLGMEPELPGDGLIFDQLQATSDNFGDAGLKIELSGNIVNLSADEVAVPPVKFTLSNKDGDHSDHWYWQPPQAYIAAHAELPFDTSFDALESDAEGVNVGFTLDNPAAVVNDGEPAMHDAEAHDESAEDAHDDATHESGSAH